MIKIKEEKTTCGLIERVYICTFCSQEHRFFHLSPRKCTVCEKILPDIDKLLENSEDKVNYHFEEGK